MEHKKIRILKTVRSRSWDLTLGVGEIIDAEVYPSGIAWVKIRGFTVSVPDGGWEAVEPVAPDLTIRNRLDTICARLSTIEVLAWSIWILTILSCLKGCD